MIIKQYNSEREEQRELGSLQGEKNISIESDLLVVVQPAERKERVFVIVLLFVLWFLINNIEIMAEKFLSQSHGIGNWKKEERERWCHQCCLYTCVNGGLSSFPHFTKKKKKEIKAQIIQEKQTENEHSNQYALSKNLKDLNITPTHTTIHTEDGRQMVSDKIASCQLNSSNYINGGPRQTYVM